MTYKTYDDYKNSGIIWVGDIPHNWQVIKSKYILDVISGGCWGKDIIEDTDGNIVLRSTEISLDGKWQIQNPAKRLLTSTEINNCLLKEGDLLVTKSSGSKKHIGKTAIVNKDIEDLKCCFSNFMTRLHTNDKFVAKLMYYLLNSIIVKSQFNYSSNSTVGLSNLNDESFKNLFIPITDIKTQNTIIKFLDKKTEEIDETISKNEKLIQLLEEKRTALINQVVTKGLNPNVPMKDSGIEWIGEIPEHWEINKLKYYGSILGGYAFKSNAFTDFGVKVVKITNVQSKTFNWNECFYLPDSYLQEYSEFKINKGDIVFALTRPIISTGIKAAIYYEEEPSLANQRTGIFKKNRNALNLAYLYYVIYSDYFKEDFKSRITATNQPNISPIDIGEIKINIPSMEEQKQIADYLDKETSKIDKTINKIKENIKLLEEYKTSLIHHVVTGKIDVRGEVL